MNSIEKWADRKIRRLAWKQLMKEIANKKSFEEHKNQPEEELKSSQYKSSKKQIQQREDAER